MPRLQNSPDNNNNNVGTDHAAQLCACSLIARAAYTKARRLKTRGGAMSVLYHVKGRGCRCYCASLRRKPPTCYKRLESGNFAVCVGVAHIWTQAELCRVGGAVSLRYHGRRWKVCCEWAGLAPFLSQDESCAVKTGWEERLCVWAGLASLLSLGRGRGRSK